MRGRRNAAIDVYKRQAYDYASLGRDVIAWVGSRRAAVRYLVYFGLVTFIIFNRSITESAFIYFQF